MNALEALQHLRSRPRGILFNLKVARVIGGYRPGAIYVIAAEAKTGKTTFALSTVLDVLVNDETEKSVVHFYSLEMDIAEMYVRTLVYAITNLEGYEFFKIGDKEWKITSNLLAGRVIDDSGKRVKIEQRHEDFIKYVFNKYKQKIFDRIVFYPTAENPTGFKRIIEKKMAEIGELKEKIVNTGTMNVKRKYFIPKCKHRTDFIVVDHIALMKEERGYNTMQIIAKTAEYAMELRNTYGTLSFIFLSQVNRDINTNQIRRRNPEFLHITKSDLKYSGAIAEAADYVLTMLNPKDEQYGITRHFGRDISSAPSNLRFIYSLGSRYSEPYYQHFLLDAGSVKVQDYNFNKTLKLS